VFYHLSNAAYPPTADEQPYKLSVYMALQSTGTYGLQHCCYNR